MKLSEIPEKYKFYDIELSNKKIIRVNGDELKAIFERKSNMIQLKTGEGFNKAFIISWDINMDETRWNIQKHKEEIEKLVNGIIKLP